MGKMFAWMIMILLALASVAGYLLLTEEIRSGEAQMAEGEKRLQQGWEKLQNGKVELAAGKKHYKRAKRNPFLVLTDKMLNGGKGFKEARTRIDKGADKIESGEERLAAGELKLSRANDQLILARCARSSLAVAAVCLAALSIIFGFRWRRALARVSLSKRGAKFCSLS